MTNYSTTFFHTEFCSTIGSLAVCLLFTVIHEKPSEKNKIWLSLNTDKGIMF